MPDTISLSEEDEIYFQQFIAYKLRRLDEIGREEYIMHRSQYDNSILLEFETLHKKLKNHKK